VAWLHLTLAGNSFAAYSCMLTPLNEMPKKGRCVRFLHAEDGIFSVLKRSCLSSDNCEAAQLYIFMYPCQDELSNV
jgi:deoxycytidylate deaminase